MNKILSILASLGGLIGGLIFLKKGIQKDTAEKISDKQKIEQAQNKNKVSQVKIHTGGLTEDQLREQLKKFKK